MNEVTQTFLRCDCAEKAERLAAKWIKDERELREHVANIRSASGVIGVGKNYADPAYHADQLDICRRELQEEFGLVGKEPGIWIDRAAKCAEEGNRLVTAITQAQSHLDDGSINKANETLREAVKALWTSRSPKEAPECPAQFPSHVVVPRAAQGPWGANSNEA